MINTNSLGIIGQFYSNIKESFKSIYQNSNFYEKKISKTFDNSFELNVSEVETALRFFISFIVFFISCSSVLASSFSFM